MSEKTFKSLQERVDAAFLARRQETEFCKQEPCNDFAILHNCCRCFKEALTDATEKP